MAVYPCTVVFCTIRTREEPNHLQSVRFREYPLRSICRNLLRRVFPESHPQPPLDEPRTSPHEVQGILLPTKELPDRSEGGTKVHAEVTNPSSSLSEERV